MNPKRIILTGGAGYIGAHTLVELLAEGLDVLVVDDLSNGSVVALDAVRSISGCDFEFVPGDVRDLRLMTETFSGFRPEAVIHMAGLKSVAESVCRPVDYYDCNIGGAMSVLRAMKAAECNRLVFSSSATVYGEPLYLPYDEAHPTRPVSPYGRTKLFIETLLSDWAAAENGRAISLRYFNPIGAHESGLIGDSPTGTPNNLMPHILQVASGRSPALRVFGVDYDTADGTGRRDYVHVCDVAAAHVRALCSLEESPGHRVINIGTGASTSVLELIAAFETANHVKVPWMQHPRRAGDLPEFFADSRLGRATLGWAPTRDIERMCLDAWRFQKKQSDDPGR